MRLRGPFGSALLALVTAALAVGAPVAARDDGALPVGALDVGPLCLLSTDEMSDLVGVPIANVQASGEECAYDTDFAERTIQVVLSAVEPDSARIDPGSDPLQAIRVGHAADGHDTTIAGQPAWAADDGAWVDLRPIALGVWLNTAFDDDPPSPDVAVAIAEVITPRFLARPQPSAAPIAGLAGRFPPTLAGSSMDPFDYPPADYLALEESMGPPNGGHVAALRDAIAGLGTTVEALRIMDGTAYDDATGTMLDAIAIQAQGLDVSPLLQPAIAALTEFVAGPAETLTIAGHQLVHLVAASGGAAVGERWYAVDGDVLWVLDGPRSLVEEMMTSLPQAPTP
ncbi:MAG: hypothetical protein U0667_15190 [Chloroflexota bacterium]